jgi:hypothetical protein
MDTAQISKGWLDASLVWCSTVKIECLRSDGKLPLDSWEFAKVLRAYDNKQSAGIRPSI